MIPIRWNFLFVIINIMMVGLLLKEQNDSNYIPEDQKEVYLKFFEKEGMSKVDFMHLFEKASRRVVTKSDEKLLTQGGLNTKVYFLSDGSCTVSRDGEIIAVVEKGSFIGEMGFVKWRENKVGRERKAEEDALQAKKDAQREFLKSSGNELEKSATYMGGFMATPDPDQDHHLLPGVTKDFFDEVGKMASKAKAKAAAAVPILDKKIAAITATASTSSTDSSTSISMSTTKSKSKSITPLKSIKTIVTEGVVGANGIDGTGQFNQVNQVFSTSTATSIGSIGSVVAIASLSKKEKEKEDVRGGRTWGEWLGWSGYVRLHTFYISI